MTLLGGNRTLALLEYVDVLDFNDTKLRLTGGEMASNHN